MYCHRGDPSLGVFKSCAHDLVAWHVLHTDMLPLSRCARAHQEAEKQLAESQAYLKEVQVSSMCK
jgi:hypothetical protein